MTVRESMVVGSSSLTTTTFGQYLKNPSVGEVVQISATSDFAIATDIKKINVQSNSKKIAVSVDLKE